MAKRDKKAGKKDKRASEAADVVEAVRGAVERTFQATASQAQPARERGRGLLDEVASAAQRIRESFDDLRVLEDVGGLRSEIESLARRVASLEQAGAKAAAKPAARRPAKAASKPAAGRSAKSSSRASKPAAGRSAKSSSRASKPAGRSTRTSTTSRSRTTKASSATSSSRSGGSSSRPAAAKGSGKPAASRRSRKPAAQTGSAASSTAGNSRPGKRS